MAIMKEQVCGGADDALKQEALKSNKTELS